jgi:hypothetical protein
LGRLTTILKRGLQVGTGRWPVGFLYDVGSLTRRTAGLSTALRTSTEDFYAVADMGTARRLGALLWILGTAIVVLLLPISPPTASALGGWGWAFTAAGIALCVLMAVCLLPTFAPRVAQRALGLELRGAGVRRPARVARGERVGLPGRVPALGALHRGRPSPRRVLAYPVVLVATIAALLAYEGWSSMRAEEAAGKLIIWGALGFVAMAFTARVRTQRLALLRERHEATVQARSDAVTGLGNRRAFDEALGAAIERVRRSGGPLSVIVADLVSTRIANSSPPGRRSSSVT